MKVAIALLLILHGCIHVCGFIKSVWPDRMSALRRDISRPLGVMWLIVGAWLALAGVLVLAAYASWWVPAAIGIACSQLLIITSWSDAKWGSVINVVLISAVGLQIAGLRFRQRYTAAVAQAYRSVSSGDSSLLREADIAFLPQVVQRYIRYCGAVGRPRVRYFMARMSGSLRQEPGSDWMPFEAVQYDFLQPARRFFFLNATMFRLPVAGFHSYNDGAAFMDIRLLSVMPVQRQSGAKMDTAETVTFFNDMCCLAPGTLIDPRIRWYDAGADHASATFTVNGITVAARLEFDSDGRLISFTSNDRFATKGTEMVRQPWETPLTDYQVSGSYRRASRAEARYRYPAGSFCYGRFRIDTASYNPAIQNAY